MQNNNKKVNFILLTITTSVWYNVITFLINRSYNLLVLEKTVRFYVIASLLENFLAELFIKLVENIKKVDKYEKGRKMKYAGGIKRKEPWK